jgi:hypothetical protein
MSRNPGQLSGEMSMSPGSESMIGQSTAMDGEIGIHSQEQELQHRQEAYAQLTGSHEEASYIHRLPARHDDYSGAPDAGATIKSYEYHQDPSKQPFTDARGNTYYTNCNTLPLKNTSNHRPMGINTSPGGESFMTPSTVFNDGVNGPQQLSPQKMSNNQATSETSIAGMTDADSPFYLESLLQDPKLQQQAHQARTPTSPFRRPHPLQQSPKMDMPSGGDGLKELNNITVLAEKVVTDINAELGTCPSQE